MGNYAFVFGVDQYDNVTPLPSCENDVNLMEGFLKSTGKYQVCRIPNNAQKHEVQDMMSSFLSQDGEEINEVLFYFSGHGIQDNRGMHYGLIDTDVNKINSTSLNDSEVDDIVRKYSPKLYVKIIDACQSGVSYIKGFSETVSEPVSLVSKGFENCIFIYSSLKTQSSYAGDPYSRFTKAVIDAVNSVSAPIVKFTDIQNYVSDVFNVRESLQTPYFSMQCDGTEVFCEKNKEVIAYLKGIFSATIDTTENSQSYVDNIKAYLKKCKDEDEVQTIMGKIQTALNGWGVKHDLLNTFYKNKFETSFPYEYHHYHEEASILNMLKGRVEKENLFVEIQYKSEKNKNPLLNSFWENYMSVPVSYISLVNQLPPVFSVHFEAMDKNLPDYVVPFIFVYSSTFFYVFTCTKQFVRKGWKEYEVGQYTKYVYTKFEYDCFSESEWNDYQRKRLIEAVSFIEKTLLEYIE